VVFANFSIPLDRTRRPSHLKGERVVLGIRPESFEDATFASDLPQLEITVTVLEELGSDAHVIFELDAPRIQIRDGRLAAQEGLLADNTRTVFNARVDARTVARTGDRLRLAVDPSALYFFDPTTGESLTG
jgi:multiple sugar transport system ATP-binding protein